jgi:hypothetical protein
MTDTSPDAGVIQVLLEELVKHRLPRILDIKEKVNEGKTLDEWELEYLEDAMNSVTRVLPLIDKHPEYQHLAGEVIHLYKEISDKDMQLEKNIEDSLD